MDKFISILLKVLKEYEKKLEKSQFDNPYRKLTIEDLIVIVDNLDKELKNESK